MPAKRRHSKRRDMVITPEAVAIFKAGKDLDPLSAEGSRLAWQLHRAVGLKPWNVPPLWVGEDDVGGGSDQSDMIEIRRELDEAAT